MTGFDKDTPEGYKPARDCYELVQNSVNTVMRPLITANFEEHEQTRNEVKKLSKKVDMLSNRKELNMVWGALVFLFLFCLFVLNTCAR